MTHAAPSDPAQAARRDPALWLAASLLVIAVLLRWAAAVGDLWLDEVWTLRLLPRMLRASDAFFHLPHANNHPLNTVYLYWLGDVADSFVAYRLHSIVAGVATVAMAGLCVRRYGREEALIALALATVSLPLVYQASQARGYAMMLAFAYAAFLAARRAIETRSFASQLVFWAAVPLGFASNLYFLHAYAALCLWTPIAIWHSESSWSGRLRALALLHAVPFITTVAFYATFYLPGLSGQQIPTDWAAIIARAGALGLGVDARGAAAWFCLFVFALLTAAGVERLRRSGDSSWWFFAGAVFLSPAVLLAWSRPIGLFTRFFVVGMALFPVLSALVLAPAWRRAGAPRNLARVALAALIVANALSVSELVRVGRGHYGDALRWLAAQEPGPTLRVGSNHDFAIEMMIDFYARFVPGTAIVYVGSQAPGPPPDWLIVKGEEPPPLLRRSTAVYEYAREFPASGLQGYAWHLYRVLSAERAASRLRAPVPVP